MNIEELRKYISLEGKTAIVTGASRPNGIGRATARSLAIRGCAGYLTHPNGISTNIRTG